MPIELRRRMRNQAPFLLVVALMLAAVGYMIIGPGHWRRGAGIIAVAMLLGGLLRLVLPEEHVGVLAVRKRWIDTTCYLGLGVAILVVAIRLQN
jgi:hypothetical protein